MKLYQDFYESYIPFDSGYEVRPQLVLVCEDERHMAETFKEIVTNRVEMQEQKVYYTTDLRQNSESLEKSWIEFKIDEETKKYKMEDVTVKLLG